MGTVLASTLALSFATIELPAAWSERSDTTLEELVSTGGADLPERIGSVYAELAAESSTPEEAEAVLAQGTILSERVAAEVREAFALATRRIYWLTVLIVVIATALVLRIPELPLRTTHDRAAVKPQPVTEGGP
jgi:hypothetical protein